MYCKNPFRNRKGSIILSIVASGAVAASIVASHQIAQNFSGSSGQDAYEQAFTAAQKALAIASLMVSRSVVACSQAHGCYIPYFGGSSSSTEDFYDLLLIEDESFSRMPDLMQNFGADDDSRALVLTNVTDRSSPLRMVSQYDTDDVEGSVVWSLRNWQKDPSVRAIFSSNQQTMAPFYKCQNNDGSINESGICSWPHDWSLERVKETPFACQDSSGNDLKDPVDPDGTSPPICVFLHDNDGEMVFISVTIPYQEAVSADRTVDRKLILNGAIRRPIAHTFVSKNYNPVCYVPCEAIGDGGSGLNDDNPICAGLSRDVDFLDGSNNGYTYFNHGPGNLYDLKMIKEDFKGDTLELLYKTSKRVSKFASQNFPNKGSAVDMDSDVPNPPCYVSSYFQPSLTRLKGDAYNSSPHYRLTPTLRADREAPVCGDVGYEASSAGFFGSCRSASNARLVTSEAVSNRGVNIHGNVAFYSRYSVGRVDRPEYVCRRKGNRSTVYVAYYCPPLSECEDDYPDDDDVQACQCRNSNDGRVDNTVCDYANAEPFRMDGLNYELFPAREERIHQKIGVEMEIPTVVVPK